MQIAETQDLHELGFENLAGEDEPAQIILVPSEHMLAEGILLDVAAVLAVVGAIGADDHEQHIAAGLTDPPGHLHEDVKAASGLQTIGAIGDDPGAGRNRRDVADAARNRAAIPELLIDAVKNRRDLVLVLSREEASLPARGTVAGRAGLQGEQVGGVLRPARKRSISEGRYSGREKRRGRPACSKYSQWITSGHGYRSRRKSAVPKTLWPTTTSGLMSGRAFSVW